MRIWSWQQVSVNIYSVAELSPVYCCLVAHWYCCSCFDVNTAAAVRSEILALTLQSHLELDSYMQTPYFFQTLLSYIVISMLLFVTRCNIVSLQGHWWLFLYRESSLLNGGSYAYFEDRHLPIAWIAHINTMPTISISIVTSDKWLEYLNLVNAWNWCWQLCWV